jgi:hypothetical protein
MVEPGWDRREAEQELRDALRGVGLVGEIDLSPDGRLFTLARGNMQQLARFGGKSIALFFPASLVVYLVGEGVYRYHHGAFWPELEVRGLVPGEMGPGFLRALEDLQLETFEHLRTDGAHRWIAPILLHGGIPKYCAADVLRLLLSEMRQGAGDADDVITRWVESPTRMFSVDRPARRFLTHGGDQAVDLIERLITMVNESAAGHVPDADELGLPSYLVTEFLGLSAHERTVRGGVTALPTPRIMFDYALGHAPELVLPPVPAHARARMWVIDGLTQQRVPASAQSEAVLPLPAGASWTVELLGDDRVLRTTTLRGVAGTPVLLFDAATGLLLRHQERLHTDDVVALSPHGFAFRDGTHDGAQVPVAVSELPVLDGAWRWHDAQHLDVRGLSTMWVGEPNPTLGVQSAEALVRIAGPSQRPHLADQPCDGVTGADGRAVYSTAPRLVVPGGGLNGFDRWRLRLTVNGESSAAQLTDLAIDGDVVDLASALPAGKVAVVDLDVIGPLGSDLRGVRFVVVPGLQVELPDRVLRPDEALDAIVLADTGIVFGHDHQSISTVEIGAGVESLALACSDGTHEVHLLLTVPRLMWSIRLGDAAVRPLGVERAVLGFDELGLDDALLVRTRRRVKLTLELAFAGSVIQELPYAETVGADGRWVFPLQKFRDTIRGSDHRRLRLQLRLDGVAVPVADVVAKYEATELCATSLVDHADGEALVHLTFKENRAFPDRQARFWSVDRPWGDVLSVDIPDDTLAAEGVLLHARLPPGRYLVEVELADGWAIPVRPQRNSPNVGLVDIGDSADLARYLRGLDTGTPLARFEYALARPGGRMELSPADAVEVAPYALMTLDSLLEEFGHKALEDPRFRVAAAAVGSATALAAGARALADRGALDHDGLTKVLVALIPGAKHEQLVGQDEVSLDRLHRLHPVLAGILDPAYIDDLAAGARWAEYLGWDPNDDDPANAYPAKGGAANATWLGLSTDRVRAIGHSLDLTDQQPLAAGGFIKAMLDWLATLEGEPDARTSSWVERFRPLNDRRVGQLSSMHLAFLEALKPTGVGVPTVARFPYDLLAAAFQLVSIGSSRSQATAALLAANAIAPALTVRSLLVAIVLDRG